jgi:hypothetical protein
MSSIVPVAGGLVAAQVGEFTRHADVAGKIHVLYVFRGIKPFYVQIGNG